MLGRLSNWGAALGAVLAVAAGMAACGGTGSTAGTSSKGTGGAHSGASGGTGAMGGGGSSGVFVSSAGSGGSMQGFDVQPAPLQTLTVTAGQNTPTVDYTATLDGNPIAAGWTLDRGDIGTIPPGPSNTATFAPSGATGGLVTIQAGLNGMTVKRQVMIQLTAQQNGSNPSVASEAAQIAGALADLTAGGGVGGVGGEGLGPGVTDQPTLAALMNPSGNGSAQNLGFIYPYDKTVWPRGMLAPLLMWSWTTGDADAIQIQLKTTSGSFSWTGTFAAPPILQQTGGKFIRHPIPQDVWDMATNSAGGTDQLTIGLTVAKGGQAYGPISETWTVAPGRLAGTVYYNSYGTGLVKNSNDNDNKGRQYGAAVLAIQGSSTAPVVVAGTNTPGDYSGTGCRVCHVVAGDGSLLIVQHGSPYPTTSSYNLKNANAETVLTGNNSVFGWAGLYGDGSLALTNTAQLAAGQPATSQLFAFPPTNAPATPLAVTGLPANFLAGAPAFSADGKHVAFEFLGGTIGTLTGSATPSQLVVLDFDKATLSFSNAKVVATLPGGGSIGGGGKNAGLPSFFPTNDAVAFHNQLSNPTGSHRYNTWNGATAQVWWSDLATGTAASLAMLNGLNGTTPYLPTNASHPDDTVLNYEPTVNPIVSGGYAWVIFTSRRLYGNLATQDPALSDPRHANYDYLSYGQVTPKKLWVAAIDLNAPAGSDPSHPAFYLPAQELVAGNARGFWVLDPCKPDGQTCATGDQCCGGYCEGPPGALTCANIPPGGNCSMPQEKCTTGADCCDPTNLCINGFCALKGIN